ncbi:MAG: helix-turn-helix transcriptional regulator [Oscillospiraceae bacterium]|nr:helix-turn-helix transcriptional regulator [Oscillospiraceae bacterium]
MTKELPSCPLQITLSLIDNKWKSLILGELLFEGTQRFSELRKALPHISQKVLTQNLRSMEESGLIVRKIFAEVPPRVEYSLTDLGYSLRPIIEDMIRWGKEYRAKAQ